MAYKIQNSTIAPHGVAITCDWEALQWSRFASSWYDCLAATKMNQSYTTQYNAGFAEPEYGAKP
ncbi:MAG: hypothetical protein ACRDF4_11800 [Rhabdochlamydiaceae bacterium]